MKIMTTKDQILASKVEQRIRQLEAQCAKEIRESDAELAGHINRDLAGIRAQYIKDMYDSQISELRDELAVIKKEISLA